MTTENNFTASAETVKENVEKGIKWLQDANQKIVQTQKEQMKQVADMFNETTKTKMFTNVDKFNNPIGDVTKEYTNLYKKNMQAVTDMFNTLMKPVTGSTKFTNFSDKDAIAKEVGSQVDKLTKQVSELTVLNQNNLNSLIELFNTTTKSLTPISEEFKKEVETAVESTKTTFEEITKSYTEFAAPTTEPIRETFEKLNAQVKESIETNIKFWTNLAKNNTTSTEEKEVKVDGRILKNTAKNKKEAATSMN